MRWQDETPIQELIAEGARTDGAYLTVARVGEDRKEAQIGSRSVGTVASAREWVDHAAEDAVRDGDARLRVRLWRADRSPLRGVTSRVWADHIGGSVESQAAEDIDAGDIDHGDRTDAAPEEALVLRQHSPPTAGVVARRAQPVATRPAHPGSSTVRFLAPPAPVPAPMYAAPCPTCAAATTTTALLQSRIAELSAMLSTASTTVRDARRDTADAEKLAKARGHRAKEAEAEVARLRTENAEIVAANRALRREVRDLNDGAAKLLAAVNSLTG